jgi:hypothetical protein
MPSTDCVFLWFGVVVALYPLCQWFAGVKQWRDEAWLSFI